MTGYGEAEGEVNDVSYAVEIKTVNNRYLKTNVKLPETVAFLEEDIEKLLRKNLSRGTINYALRFKQASANAMFDIDEIALQDTMARLSRLKSSTDINLPWQIDISNLLNLPGIIRPAIPNKEMAEQIKDVVLKITQEAIDKLKQMRAAEGNFLEADLKNHCKAIKQDLERICARSAVVLKEYAKRLKKRVDELLSEAKLKLDEETLAREIAVLADKSDISEETARLDSHLMQFAECYKTNLPKAGTGRKLDFLSQEMLREANTIASKAPNAEIIHYVVDIKCQIERIKEQVQNVE